MDINANSQRQRWGFTFNNYSPSLDVRAHLSKSNFLVKRGIWGYERGERGTPHLQGYLELKRSLRPSHLRKIFPTAYWYGARGSAAQNVQYCIKEGNFDVLGDFSHELTGSSSKSLSLTEVVKAVVEETLRREAEPCGSAQNELSVTGEEQTLFSQNEAHSAGM